MTVPIYFPLLCICCIILALYLYASVSFNYYDTLKVGLGLEMIFVIVIVSCSVLSIHAWLSAGGWYINDKALPWRLSIAFGVTFSLLLVHFIHTNNFNDMGLYGFTLLQSLRLPIEILYFLMSKHDYLPNEVTLGGYNFDIFFGISAPFVAEFCYRRDTLSPTIGAWWQFAATISLLISSVLLLLSVSSPLQLIGYEQPNIAFEFFPFMWIPAMLVPVLLTTQFSLLKSNFDKVSTFWVGFF